jgi:NAD(P)H-hydrate repair Nnr-like enzyme with NAD(P)H-hydrate dehydratase domain
MSTDYWYKQDTSKPLFPELEWSKPENKRHAGKLLIIGGNLHGFAAPANAFAAAVKAGIGTNRVILPSAIQKAVKTFMPEADFAPSTPSGSFSAKSIDVFLEHAGWSDAVLVAGDLGRNSETAIALESFITKYDGPLSLTKDAVDYVLENPESVLSRPDTLLVTSFAQLQKFFVNTKLKTPITFDMDLLRLVAVLHDFTLTHKVSIILKHRDVMLVASEGKVSSTKLLSDKEIWRVETAATATVWWLQHPRDTFKALTTAVAA